MKKERFDSGKQTVNFANVDYLEVVKNEDELELYYLYRPKIKTEKLMLKRKFSTYVDLTTYLKKLNFFKLGNYFINTTNYTIVDEVEISSDKKKVEIILYMKNAQPLELTLPITEWNNFKNSRLL